MKINSGKKIEWNYRFQIQTFYPAKGNRRILININKKQMIASFIEMRSRKMLVFIL
jgi:hypothetical protein